MKKIAIFYLIILASLNSESQLPQWDWAKKVTPTYTSQTTSASCTDKFGNVFVLGQNGYSLTQDTISFIIKYLNNGQFGWKISVKGYPNSIGTDNNGNLYVAGSYTGSTPGNAAGTSAGGKDIFISKYDGSGALAWVRSFGNAVDESAYALQVTKAGEVYITGKFSNTITFGNVLLVDSNEYFLAKLNTNGTVLWAKKAPSTIPKPNYVYRYGYSLALDKYENIYVVCSGDQNMYSYNTESFSIFKYNQSGILLFNNNKWSLNETPIHLAIDSNLNIYTVVEYSYQSTHQHLQKFDQNMNIIWYKYLASPAYYTSYGFGNGLIIDHENNILLGGYCGDFDHSKGDTINIEGTILISKGNSDILVSRISGTDGTFLKHYIAGTVNNDRSVNLCIDPKGNYFLTGCFNNASANSNTQTDTLCFGNECILSSGKYDQAFVAKLKVSEYVFSDNVSVKEEPNALNLKVYPNPSNGLFSIDAGETNEKLRVRVYDSAGSCIFTQTVSNKKEIDLTGHPAGIYFVEAIDGDKTYRQKLIIH